MRESASVEETKHKKYNTVLNKKLNPPPEEESRNFQRSNAPSSFKAQSYNDSADSKGTSQQRNRSTHQTK